MTLSSLLSSLLKSPLLGLPLSRGLPSSPFSLSSYGTGSPRSFLFEVNRLDRPGSGRLMNVKVTSPPEETGSESSEIVSSGCLHFCKVWLDRGLRGNYLDLVVGILPCVEV